MFDHDYNQLQYQYYFVVALLRKLLVISASDIVLRPLLKTLLILELDLIVTPYQKSVVLTVLEFQILL